MQEGVLDGLTVKGVATESIAARGQKLFDEHRRMVLERTDRMFIVLMLGQWVFAIGLALIFSPYAWEGKVRTVNAHVYAAVLLGGAITSLPVALALLRPGWVVTRHVIAAAQMLWSALLIHLTGGRIETHFHVFGSLAFLAFYRDWKVLIPATVVIAVDHLLRGIFWPESVYGLVTAEWWRTLEHAGWVVFEDVFLVVASITAVREMQRMALRHAEVEALSEKLAGSEKEKSMALDRALSDLKVSHDAVLRSEKLAAVGQLAASMGHELRNPIGAVRNATTYIGKRLAGSQVVTSDPKVTQFLSIVDRELDVCTKIISDLLDFARERRLVLQPCPLGPLVDETIGVVVTGKVRVENRIPIGLPVPHVDHDQLRQVVLSLIENAIEAMPVGKTDGVVTVTAEGGAELPWRIRVSDNGSGMTAETAARIFEPLYTTKTTGTGLGLAIVANVVKAHGGSIRLESEPDKGTTVEVELPKAAARKVA